MINVLKTVTWIVLLAFSCTLSACDDGADSSFSGDTDVADNDGEPSALSTYEIGGFMLDFTFESAQLDIIAPDGRLLVQGLGAVPVEGETPSRSGFAVRDIALDFEDSFGSYRPIEEANGPWIVSTRLSVAGHGDGEISFSLQADDGNELARLTFTSPDEGHLKAVIEPKEAGSRFSWGFACDGDDHFMGFGSQSWDVDHRGFTVPTWVEEQGLGKVENDEYDASWLLGTGRRHSAHIPIPQYWSRRGYILTAETDLRAVFALCSEDEQSARVEIETPSAIHLFDGPTYEEAIERASARFGRPRVPPDFAFAPWLDATYGSENVRRVAEKLREKKIPSSVIWSEDWKGAFWSGDDYVLTEEWEVDRDLYPDFETLADELHTSGFKFFVYFNSFIYKNAKVWDETAPNDYLIQDENGEPFTFLGHKFSDSSLVDLSNPDAREWAKSKLHDAMDLGADGWMGDFGEWMPIDAHTYEGSGLEQHNLHPVQWQEIQREAIDERTDGVERLFFSRSGYFGTPELADVVWAADQRTAFWEDDGLPTILPIGIGLGVVGISTYGHDIAGYQAVNNSNPPATKELFFRWTTLGAWSPVMRTHHGKQANLNWNWESDDETVEHFRRWAAFHIQLAPFWKGLAAYAHETGVSIWRGLGTVFPEDEKVWPIKDQVMVGDTVMLAPVMVEGALSREAYLPEGLWYDWDDEDGPTAGETNLTIEALLGEIPVLVRAGGIVPMYPDGVMTLANASAEVPGPESVGDDRVLHVFLGADGAFAEKNGLTYRLEQLTEMKGSVSFSYTWKNEAVPGCTAEDSSAPCVLETGAHRDRLKLSGTGELEIAEDSQTVARLTVEGGDATRELTVDLRR